MFEDEEIKKQLQTGEFKSPGFVYYPGYDLELALASVGKGWAKLIEEAFAKKPPEINIDQVKEKFAVLTIYTDIHNKEYSNILQELADRSTKTCETCGEPGKIRGKGYYYTACDKHSK